MKGRNCKNCAFFDQTTTQCRRYPPVWTVNVQGWPAVRAVDWCGEHVTEAEMSGPYEDEPEISDYYRDNTYMHNARS